MKKLIVKLLLLIVVIVGFGFLITSCNNEPNLSPQERVKQMLTSGTWNLQNANVDGVDRTSVYAGFTITFSDRSFTTTHGGQQWLQTDSWTFADEDGKTITRGDGLPIAVDVTDSSLKLSFTWASTTFGSGRTSSIKGQHELTFSK